MVGVESCGLAIADVDGPASLGVVVDRIRGGVAGLFVVGVGRFEIQLLAAKCDLEVGQNEVAVAGAAGAFSRQRRMSKRSQADGGDLFEVGFDHDTVGIVVGAAIVGEERVVAEQLEAGVGFSAVFDVLNRGRLGGGSFLLCVELFEAGALGFFPSC